MQKMQNEELENLLELGPVRLRIDGEMKQLTRDMGTADTCNCHEGQKSCGFISELEWREALLTWDKEGSIGVWDIGEHKFLNIQAYQVEKIIGHGEDEPSTKSCCNGE